MYSESFYREVNFELWLVKNEVYSARTLNRFEHKKWWHKELEGADWYVPFLYNEQKRPLYNILCIMQASRE